jgi:DNA-directed RNA polymerase specialized sigma24 family protein
MLEERPTRRSQCKDGPRPCPWIACKHNKFIESIDSAGRIQRRVPGSNPEDIDPTDSCALDQEEQEERVARQKGGLTYQKIGNEFGISRERIRQIEEKVFEKIRNNPEAKRDLEPFLEHDPPPAHRSRNRAM